MVSQAGKRLFSVIATLAIGVSLLAMLAACSPSLPGIANGTTTSSGNGALGWPFDTHSGSWAIENGYNTGPDHSGYELDSFDFQRQDATTTGQTVLSPATGAVIDFGSAYPYNYTSGHCARISVNGYSGYYVMVCHLVSVTAGNVKRGDSLGAVAGGANGNHIHITLYYLTPGTPDTKDHAKDRKAISFSDPWTIAGCSYPASGAKNEWHGQTAPCGATATATKRPTTPSSNSTIYIGSGNGAVSAVRSSDGAVLWTHQTGAYVASKPEIYSGVVYVGSDDGNLYALSAQDGHELWRFPTGGKVDDHPAIANGIVFFGSWDGTVYAVRADNGNLVWTFHTGGFVFSSPTIANGVIYIGSADSKLYALRQSDGSMIWSYATGDMVDATPTVAGDTVYIGSWDQNLYALRSSDGSVIWRFRAGLRISANMPVIVNGVVYFGSSDDSVYAVHASSGSLIWQFQANGHISCTPAIVNSVLYIGSDDGNMYALDATTGTKRWVAHTGGIIGWAQPIVVNGRVFIGSQDGYLYAWQASNGSLIWRTDIGSVGRIPSPPSVG